MPDYHGYSMGFEWDRTYFIPFIQYFCFCFGWIPIALGLLLLYLLFNHSPMYSKEFRNAISAYHFNQMFYDIHHSYLFNPYPLFPMPIFVCNGLLCRWKAPTALLFTFTGIIASVGSVGLSTVVFMRLRNLLPLESRFRLSVRQSIVLMGFTAVLFVANAVGFGLYGKDDPRKMEIMNRSEFLWLQDRPDALVWGDMFDTPALDKDVREEELGKLYSTSLLT
ncbi:hypothetical protein PENTCL1PPCAC_11031 [Pristionchus entomophagus]|uniref:G protein-coupled receptor n=1 Tax=Pristionchus entomophagus TaxID=358040 RepID=A0AAV5SZT2_9BILA|nr:hypothetical protein PENTCL1PPCAC_11031 [Pristionchus entomophagus]